MEPVLKTETTTEHKILRLENRNTDFEFSTTSRPKNILVDPNNDILQIREIPLLLEHYSYDEVVSYIITNQHKADEYSWTLLHFAAKAGQTDIAVFLIVRGADVNAMDIECRIPIDLAINKGRKEIAKLLIAKGAARRCQQTTDHVRDGDALGYAQEDPRAFQSFGISAMQIPEEADVASHSRYVIFQMAEVAMPQTLLQEILARIQQLCFLAIPAGPG